MPRSSSRGQSSGLSSQGRSRSSNQGEKSDRSLASASERTKKEVTPKGGEVSRGGRGSRRGRGGRSSEE